MKVDLHIHTTGSDGLLPREDILELASQNRVRFISFTDHNYFKPNLSLKQKAEENGIKLINGVEVSARYHHYEIHLLGYGMENIDPELDTYFQRYVEQKTAQTQARCQKSQENPLLLKSGKSLSLSFEELSQLSREGARLWNDMIYFLPEKFNQLKRMEDPLMTRYDAQGLLLGITRAYEKFKDSFTNLEKGKRLWSVHFPIEYLPAGRVIELIQNSKGLSSLAHPGEQALDTRIITELRQVGLDALETFTPKNRLIDYYYLIAQELGLLHSGGTDFHYPSSHHHLGRILRDRQVEEPRESDFDPISREKITLLDRLL